ncbi:MAG: Smr/MutS family protein [Spirochaetales bacterium]
MKEKKYTSKNSSDKSGVNPIDAWLNEHGVIDKDSIAKKYESSRTAHSPVSAKKLPIDAKIDLHNFTQEEAWQQLRVFIGTCKQQGCKKVLIVHGKGTHSKDKPVLANLVHRFIEQDSRLGTSGYPGASQGGTGATWVIIK